MVMRFLIPCLFMDDSIKKNIDIIYAQPVNNCKTNKTLT